MTIEKPFCKLGIDCSECGNRGACTAYAAFMYEKGRQDMKKEMESYEKQTEERFRKKC